MNEIEIKFLEIDPELIEKKLVEIGAGKDFDEMFEEWLYAKPEWESTRGRVRIRKEGKKTTLAYKETKQATSKGNLEIEFGVANAEQAKEFIDKLELGTPRHQQKRRIHYTLHDIEIAIDFWPHLPPMIEIEGADVKKLEKLAKELNLDEKKRCDLDAFQIYTQIYKIPIGTMKELVFEK